MFSLETRLNLKKTANFAIFILVSTITYSAYTSC